MDDDLETCKKYRDAYAECERIATEALREAIVVVRSAVKRMNEPCYGDRDARLDFYFEGKMMLEAWLAKHGGLSDE